MDMITIDMLKVKFEAELKEKEYRKVLSDAASTPHDNDYHGFCEMRMVEKAKKKLRNLTLLKKILKKYGGVLIAEDNSTVELEFRGVTFYFGMVQKKIRRDGEFQWRSNVVEYLDMVIKGVGTPPIMPYGKYKGLHLNDIDDENYFKWFCNNIKNERDIKLFKRWYKVKPLYAPPQ